PAYRTASTWWYVRFRSCSTSSATSAPARPICSSTPTCATSGCSSSGEQRRSSHRDGERPRPSFPRSARSWMPCTEGTQHETRNCGWSSPQHRPPQPRVGLGGLAAEDRRHGDGAVHYALHDVRRGDTMSFTWRPGTGIEVTLRGEVRGSVPDDQ